MTNFPHLAQLRRFPCFSSVLLLCAWVLVAAPAGAQSNEYALPGAIELLKTEAYEEFPDNLTARQWLNSFIVVVAEGCGIEGANYAGVAAMSGIGFTAFAANLMRYQVSAGQGVLHEGREDGVTFVAREGCEAAPGVLTTAYAITSYRGDTGPVAGDIRAFARLMNPTLRAEIGFGADGLTANQRGMVDRIGPAVERYLRTRQTGRVEQSELTQLAREVAAMVVTSGISARSAAYLMRTNDDGEEVFRLFPMTPMAVGMIRDGTPHPPLEGEYEQQFMHWWARMQPSHAAEEGGESRLADLWDIVLSEIPNNAPLPLRSLEVRDIEREGHLIDGLRRGIGRMLPPPLAEAFNVRPTNWSAPAQGTTGSIEGRIVGADDGAPIRNAQVYVKRGARTVAPTVQTEADGSFRIADVPNGEIRLSVSAADRAVTGQDVRVLPGATARVEFELECTTMGVVRRRCLPTDPDAAANPPTAGSDLAEADRARPWIDVDWLWENPVPHHRYVDEWGSGPRIANLEEINAVAGELVNVLGSRGGTSEFALLIDSAGRVVRVLGTNEPSPYWFDYSGGSADAVEQRRERYMNYPPNVELEAAARPVLAAMRFSPAQTCAGVAVPLWLRVSLSRRGLTSWAFSYRIVADEFATVNMVPRAFDGVGRPIRREGSCAVMFPRGRR